MLSNRDRQFLLSPATLARKPVLAGLRYLVHVQVPQDLATLAAIARIRTFSCCDGLGIPAMNTTLEMKVNDFLGQKRIAIAGVSRDTRKHPVGNLIYQRLKRSGHDVFAVNPHMQFFEGGPCYPNLQSIPEGVDGVVIITRPEVT